MTRALPRDVLDWVARGSRHRIGSDHVWVLDVAPAGTADGPPVVLVHGFPTCAWDWRHLVPELARTRRVLALDLPGYGGSAKPDRSYPLHGQADAVAAVVEAAGIDEVDLVTHDMGDSVGGELLARSLDGSWGVAVRRRVVTNGSIYLDLAHLTAAQRIGERLPDRRLAPALSPLVAALYRQGLRRVLPAAPAGEIDALWALTALDDGHLLLPRLIRYLEGRRIHERRWTGAIEAHAAPLTVVWGTADPVADVAMAQRLARARPDARVVLLDGVGHFPMLDAPARFNAAVVDGLIRPEA